MGYTMFTVNPLTSMALLEIYVAEGGRALNYRLFLFKIRGRHRNYLIYLLS